MPSCPTDTGKSAISTASCHRILFRRAKIEPMKFGLCLFLAAGVSQWVYFGPDHKLHYRTDAQGNRIMDFSSAGYKAGGVRLPVVAVVKKLSPVPGDNTAQIQAAVDAVPAGGSVLLQPGEYTVSGTIHMNTSGVVLRGSGSGDDGTTIKLTGPPHRFLEIRGSGTYV